MHKDEIKGSVKEAVGKVQSKFGQMADSPVDQDEGARKQVEGKLEKGVGKIKNALHKAID